MDVIVGKGKHDGKGVYANRDFKKGEVVATYKLKLLTQDEFDNLPKGEWRWTHSFYGEIYLFPEPERYVNNSKNPTTYPDFEKQADIALRDIQKGEAITINNNVELTHELESFLIAYEKAANSRDFSNVSRLIADDVVFKFTNGTFKGKDDIQKAFEDTWEKIIDENYKITNVKWVKKSYWNSVCEYEFKSDGLVNGVPQVYSGKGRNELKRIKGNWRIVNEKLTKQE
jgi:ketosteroid isomerase-like protein